MITIPHMVTTAFFWQQESRQLFVFEEYLHFCWVFSPTRHGNGVGIECLLAICYGDMGVTRVYVQPRGWRLPVFPQAH